MAKYRWWECLENMPDGWVIDSFTGSPLHGYVFITNGKSPLNGQKRALLRVHKKAARVVTAEQPAMGGTCEKINEKTKPKETIIDFSTARPMQEYARKKFQEHFLRDVLVDMQICELEGWDKREYLRELKILLDGFGVKL